MKFTVEIDVEIPTSLEHYTNVQGDATRSKLLVMAKDRIAFDVADALRLYGIEAYVNHVSRRTRA